MHLGPLPPIGFLCWVYFTDSFLQLLAHSLSFFIPPFASKMSSNSWAKSYTFFIIRLCILLGCNALFHTSFNDRMMYVMYIFTYTMSSWRSCLSLFHFFFSLSLLRSSAAFCFVHFEPIVGSVYTYLRVKILCSVLSIFFRLGFVICFL